jgi:hypothetical protein
MPFDEIHPGKYQISFKYVSIRPHSPSEETPERRAIASKFSIFEGSLQTISVSIEVVPKN